MFFAYTYSRHSTYVWYKEVFQSFLEALQGHTSEKENDKNQIWKRCCDVYNLKQIKIILIVSWLISNNVVL